MKNVDVNSIISTSVELNEIVSSVKGAIDSCVNSCGDLFAAVQTLGGYNGKKVAGSDYYKQIERNIDGNIVKKIRHSYNYWMITGTDSVLEYCRSLQSEIGRLADIMNKVYSELAVIEESGGVIDNYINKTGTQLKNYNLEPESMEYAFRYLNGKPGELSKIAYDGERAANGETIASDKILTEYWIDKPLSFVKQDDGTYNSMQEDDMGNPTVMGSVSAMGTAVYLASLINSTGAASKDAYLLMKAGQDAKNSLKNDLEYTKIINVDGDEFRYYRDDLGNISKVIKVDKETGIETVIKEQNVLVNDAINVDNNTPSVVNGKDEKGDYYSVTNLEGDENRYYKDETGKVVEIVSVDKDTGITKPLKSSIVDVETVLNKPNSDVKDSFSNIDISKEGVVDTFHVTDGDGNEIVTYNYEDGSHKTVLIDKDTGVETLLESNGAPSFSNKQTGLYGTSIKDGMVSGAASKDNYLLERAAQDARNQEISASNIASSDDEVVKMNSVVESSVDTNILGDEVRTYKYSDGSSRAVYVDTETGKQTQIFSVDADADYSAEVKAAVNGEATIKYTYDDGSTEQVSRNLKTGEEKLILKNGEIVLDDYDTQAVNKVSSYTQKVEVPSHKSKVDATNLVETGVIADNESRDTYFVENVVQPSSVVGGADYSMNEVVQDVSNNTSQSEFVYLKNESEKQLLSLINNDKNFVVPEGTTVSFGGQDFIAKKDMYYEYNEGSKGYSLVNSDGSKSGNYPKTMISKWELK